ncbi:MAG: hypothetical protein ABI551_03585 [Polyangiaceae bacterium]
MIRKPTKKRPAPRRGLLRVDPTRLSLAALERIKTVLSRTGHIERFGEPVPPHELRARETVLLLPPSYLAAMKVCGSFGETEVFLNASEMRKGHEELVALVAEKNRYYPFARSGEKIYAFDRLIRDAAGELGVVIWAEQQINFVTAHFAEWLDLLADAREEDIDRAAVIPSGLRRVLIQLGFTFDDPIVGRLETGDAAAIESLLGPDRAREVKGGVGRLFDSSGKASLVLNLDEFSLAISLRTGIFMFEAEEVFRWLRLFRDENFFGDTVRQAAHADNVRDLRAAPREPPLIRRGVIEVATIPAKKYTFRAASGRSGDDFFLLGRTRAIGATHDAAMPTPSVILHVLKGIVREAHSVADGLLDLHAGEDGTMWALTAQGQAVRFGANGTTSFQLERPKNARPWWYGIGGSADKVYVWGAGALLEFDGRRFIPFVPDASLDNGESIVALAADQKEITMLVCGDHMGAVARYNGRKWASITEGQVIDTILADLDVWQRVPIVLARDGRVWRIDEMGIPRAVIWDRRQEAFLNLDGSHDRDAPRATLAIRGVDGGAVVASEGGVIVVGSGEPVFHSAGETREETRISRVGTNPATAAIVAMCGSHVWTFQRGELTVLDLKDW